jgi:glycosyltransferase involved in cell wall biosynthesis
MMAIVICTHNRAPSLRRTLDALVPRLPAGDSVRLIVVDNNSTDETPAVCASYGPMVTYVREPRQGLSYARNSGVAAATGLAADDPIAFTDDDVVPADDWIRRLQQAFDAHPEVEGAGGRVLPNNPDSLPGWLTRAHWGPLALQDHGPEQRRFDRQQPLGLVGANFAFRRRVFDTIGGFCPDVQRVKDGIGSTEDHDFLRRLYDAGGTALYAPEVVVMTNVPPERTTRAYHRRWHRGHGRFHALMRIPDIESARLRIFGVPLHLVRRALRDALTLLRSSLVRDRAAAFAAETRLWFFSGFFKERFACLARR